MSLSEVIYELEQELLKVKDLVLEHLEPNTSINDYYFYLGKQRGLEDAIKRVEEMRETYED